MTDKTTRAIAKFSKTNAHESLLRLMAWYGVNSLEKISEQQALHFLELLESGEIKLDGGERID